MLITQHMMSRAPSRLGVKFMMPLATTMQKLLYGFLLDLQLKRGWWLELIVLPFTSKSTPEMFKS